MRIQLEKRTVPSRLMVLATPILSIAVTMLLGAGLFEALGYDGVRAVKEIFITPIVASYKWDDVAAKAAPLILIALGLSLCNRASIWNIGGEGQYLVGAVAGTGVALATTNMHGAWIIPTMLVAGFAGGAAWGAIPALLRTRFNVNEVLSSLMLVYVAMQLLNYLVTGPWKDPRGYNFPQTAPFTPDQSLPHVLGGAIPPGIALATVMTGLFWVIMTKSVFGFQIRTVGAAPDAARYGGIDATRIVWSTLMISGGMAGLAGIMEVASQLGRLNLGFPSGYGFTAIIVSFLGRSNAIGVFLAGLVLAVSYVGGQVAQSVVHVPNATAGIFQALLLFLILASDVLLRYRLRIVPSVTVAATAGGRP